MQNVPSIVSLPLHAHMLSNLLCLALLCSVLVITQLTATDIHKQYNQMHVLWPEIAGMGNLICDGMFACEDINFPVPHPTVPYHLDCNSIFECTESDIYCPIDAECNIDCSGMHSCTGANIYCESYQDCNIKCQSSSGYACYRTNIYSSIVTPNRTHVACQGRESCTDQNVTLYYPPTESPTQSPSNPSVSPTEFPTMEPSNPTVDPTNFPSETPTAEPTDYPTESPLNSPSVSPVLLLTGATTSPPTTDLPTVSPTLPSYSPSPAPTSPSLSPTISPTRCIDDDITSYSVDGTDVIANRTKEISTILNLHMINRNISESVLSSVYNRISFGRTIQCQNGVDTCYFKCDKNESCNTAIIQNYNMSVTNLIIDCNGIGSCYQLAVNISKSEIKRVEIVCNGHRSCESMEINILDSNIESFQFQCVGYKACKHVNYVPNTSDFVDITLICNEELSCSNMKMEGIVEISNLTLFCIHTSSCRGLEMDLLVQNHSLFTISCFNDYSCEYLSIKAERSTAIDIHMYRYSNNVSIIHGDVDNVNITCGDAEDKLFLRYDIASLKTEAELLSLGRNEYNDSKQYPCEGISINCTSAGIKRSCNYQYEVNQHRLDIEKFLKAGDSDDIECYWVDIFNIITPRCYGQCGDFELYRHHTSFDFRITININNTNETDLEKMANEIKCNKFFGSINNTKGTLTEIDAIFENVIGVLYVPGTIYQIINGPYSYLTHGIQHLHCTDPDAFQIINLNVSMDIMSSINDTNIIETLWTKDSFSLKVTELLSLLFDEDINIHVIIEYVQLPIQMNTSHFLPDEWIYAIAGGLVIFVSCILCMIWQKKHKRNVMLQKLTTYITNPLVIAIAIGDYDDNVDEKEVDGYLDNLTSIHKDIENLHKLFGVRLNYDIAPEYDINGYIKTRWTKREFFGLLQNSAKYLDEAVRTRIHDALIVIVSCHGVQDHIVTSDYKVINKDTIHRMFSVDHHLLRDIPRIFFYDCCDGENDMNREHHRNSVPMKPEPITFQSSKGAQGGHARDSSIMSNSNSGSGSSKLRRVTDIYGADKDSWFKGEHNPDYKLAIINSSNTGFTSQMGANSGSFMIRRFTEEMSANLDNKNRLFLYEVFHKIQECLHSEKIQLIEPRYNNKLEYIKFKKNYDKLPMNGPSLYQKVITGSQVTMEMTIMSSLDNLTNESKDSDEKDERSFDGLLVEENMIIMDDINDVNETEVHEDMDGMKETEIERICDAVALKYEE